MKNLLLLAAILGGIFLPEGAEYSFLVKYLLMGLLFFAFLKLKIDNWRLQKSHLIIVFFPLIISTLSFFLIRNIDYTLAQITFLSLAAPTAIAVPSIINLLKGNIEYSFISMLVTNLSAALFFPPALSYFVMDNVSISMFDILGPVLLVILIPLLIALPTKYLLKQSKGKINPPKDISFYILVTAIFLGVSKASDFVRENVDLNDSLIFLIPVVILLTVVLNFLIGYFAGEQEFKLEASQSLGQKNNAFLIWIAITFINPLVALGPVSYVVFQNIYVSFQLYGNKD